MRRSRSSPGASGSKNWQTPEVVFQPKTSQGILEGIRQIANCLVDFAEDLEISTAIARYLCWGAGVGLPERWKHRALSPVTR